MKIEINLSAWTNCGELSVIKTLHPETEIELIIIDDIYGEGLANSSKWEEVDAVLENSLKLKTKDSFEKEKAKDLLIILLFFGEKNLKTLTFQTPIVENIW